MLFSGLCDCESHVNTDHNCRCCLFLYMYVVLESYFCRTAAAGLLVADLRGQITTHRAAGCSIFAISQWRLLRNICQHTSSHWLWAEQMLQASDKWTRGVYKYRGWCMQTNYTYKIWWFYIEYTVYTVDHQYWVFDIGYLEMVISADLPSYTWSFNSHYN